MIFGEDFGQLAASGEYEVYKKGTTVAQLQAAVDGLSDEEYFDSFLTISDDSSITVENNVLFPFRASSRMYLCDMCYPTNSIVITTYYGSGFVEEITKAISSGALVRTVKSTSGTGASLLTLNSWTLYRRQKGYDVANGGSNVAYAIAPVQTSLSSADKNYAVGEQFLYDGHLYKVISAITSGAQIVIGTNAVLAGSITQQMGINDASLLLPDSIRKVPTLNRGTISYDGTFYYKIGTRVHVNIAVTGLGSLSSATILFTLPAGYRPSNYIVYSGYTGGHSTASEAPKGFVDSAGNVTYDPTPSGVVYASVEFDAFA